MSDIDLDQPLTLRQALRLIATATALVPSIFDFRDVIERFETNERLMLGMLSASAADLELHRGKRSTGSSDPAPSSVDEGA